MEDLAGLQVVADLELVVPQQSPVSVHDPLRRTRGAGRVRDQGRIVRVGRDRVGVLRQTVEQLRGKDNHRCAGAGRGDRRAYHRFMVLVGDDHPRRAVAQPVGDGVALPQRRHHHQDRADPQRPQGRRRGLRQRRQDQRDPVAPAGSPIPQQGAEPVGRGGQLGPSEARPGPSVVGPQHRHPPRLPPGQDINRHVVLVAHELRPRKARMPFCGPPAANAAPCSAWAAWNACR